MAAYHAIVKELKLFNEELLARNQLVVATKLDALADARALGRLKAM